MPHPYFDAPRPSVLGHRGAAGDAPENTLLAFELGLAAGAHILESDVHLTRDGTPVLIHDAAVDRTTEASGAVASFTLTELQRLDAGHRFSPDRGATFPYRGQGHRIPTLEEAFASFPGVRFNLELKAQAPDLVPRCIELVEANAREGLTLLAAEGDTIMDGIRGELQRRGVSPALGASVRDVLEVIQASLEKRAPATDAMALQIPTEFGGAPLVTPALIDHAHRHGIIVHVWTVNDESEFARLLELGVDGIVTDYPGRMTRWLAERGDTG